MRKPTQREFKQRASKLNCNKYDYSKVEYINSRSKVIITCPVHGDFKQTPSQHLRKRGCVKCGAEVRAANQTSNTNDFIKKAKRKHKSKYNYSKVKYLSNREKVIITCPTHGDFKQTPNNHLSGSGCRKCGARYKGWSFSEWYNSAQTSKHFDSFKVYLLDVKGENERFFKIGLTYRRVSVRFDSEECLPYSYKIINIKESTGRTDKVGAKRIFDMEKRFKRMYIKSQYIPSIEFGGMYECFEANQRRPLSAY